MSGLDNLISKIINDSEEESRLILFNAEKKAAEMVSESADVAEKEKERIIESAKAEAEKAAEQIVTGKKLEIRNEHLNAKREVIERVFGIVLEKLNNMSKNEFSDFLCKQLLTLDLDGEELLLPSKYGVKDIGEINALLAENGKKANLTLYSGDRVIDGGFILLKNGIENNNTFKTLVEYYRYELESDITAKLF